MKLKYKISILVIGIFLVASLFISSSYALWVFTKSQEGTNVVVTDCFEIRFGNEQNAIKLEYSFPMKDSLGVQLTPFTFSVTNVCNHAADLQINLETLTGSTLDSSNIKADLNGFLTAVEDAESVTPTITGAVSAVKLEEYTLEGNESKTYNLRLWVKEDAIQNEVENTSYSSKISIKSILRKKYDVAMLKKGENFNVALKTLAGDNNPSYFSDNNSITSIQRSLTAPNNSDNATLISDTNSANDIYAWFKNGTIYIYSDTDKIYMNRDSSHMFSDMKGVETLDVSYFDTSKVTNMSDIFDGMTNLTSLDVSHFDTSNVTNMCQMFYGLSSLTSLDVSNFNTSKVTDMANMFLGMSSLTSLDVSHFDTSNVTYMSGMFRNLKKLASLDVSHFDTSKVTIMDNMFYGMSNLTSLDVSHFDTSNVTNMSWMFHGLSSLTSIDVSHFDTSNVTDMSSMFAWMYDLTSLDVSHFNTSKVTNMMQMFLDTKKITNIDVSHFDTSNVTNMYNMFSGMNALTSLDVSNFNTSKVTNMDQMFPNMNAITSLDLSSFDTSNVENMRVMFKSDTNLKTIYVSNKWNTSKVTNSENMFKNCSVLVGGAGTIFDANHTDASYAHVDEGQSNPGYFTLKTN